MISRNRLEEKRQEVLRLADAKIGYVSKAWLESVQAVRDMATLEQLATALMNNDVYAIQRIYSPDAVQLQLTGFKDALTNVYTVNGVKLASQVPQAGIYFNQVNPRLVDIVNTWTNNLITNETQATIQRIGQEIGKATLQGKNPLVGARKIRDSIGLTPQQVKAVQNYERALRGMGNPKSYTLRDKRLDTKKLLTEEMIEKRVERYRQKQLKYRAETIARTEALRMTNMANQHLYENAIQEGTIQEDTYRRYWVSTRDNRTRDAHRTLPSMNKEGRAINEPFRSSLGLIMYPHDPNASPKNTIGCRCVVVYDLVLE
jgi:hypothetical protein